HFRRGNMACSTPAPGIRPADKGSEIHDPPFLDPPASRDEPIDLIAYWPMIIDSIESTTHARFPQHRTSFKAPQSMSTGQSPSKPPTTLMPSPASSSTVAIGLERDRAVDQLQP